MSATEQKLKPCPFCGDAEPTLKETANARDTGPVCIHCDACGADGPQCDYTEDAVANWNRRAPTGATHE